MKLFIFLLWFLVGIFTLLFATEISKIVFGCTWAALMLTLLITLVKGEK